jgi:hypothetical protein
MKGLNVFILKLIGKLHCKQVTEEDRRQKGMFTCAFSLKKTTALKLSDLESENPPQLLTILNFLLVPQSPPLLKLCGKLS